MKNLIFDLQIFGGKGGTTVQSIYEPTEYELQLQQLEVDLVQSAYNPQAKDLANTAGVILKGSIGAMPVGFNEIFANGAIITPSTKNPKNVVK